jgi:hypothetical protein
LAEQQPAETVARSATAPPRSPERSALAEAIARRSTAEERLQRIETALARAGEMGRETFRAEDRAAAALADARQAEPHFMADALLADREPGVSPLRAAEAALVDVREQREAARNAEAVLREQLNQERTAVEYAHRAVRRAVAAVFAASPAIEAAIARLEAAAAELVAAGDAVSWLSRARVLDINAAPPGGWRRDSDDIEQRARRALHKMDVPAAGWLRDRPTATEGWTAGLAALENDPDAPLPDFEAT